MNEWLEEKYAEMVKYCREQKWPEEEIGKSINMANVFDLTPEMALKIAKEC